MRHLLIFLAIQLVSPQFAEARDHEVVDVFTSEEGELFYVEAEVHPPNDWFKYLTLREIRLKRAGNLEVTWPIVLDSGTWGFPTYLCRRMGWAKDWGSLQGRISEDIQVVVLDHGVTSGGANSFSIVRQWARDISEPDDFINFYELTCK